MSAEEMHKLLCCWGDCEADRGHCCAHQIGPARLSALSAAGWVVVPREPTEAMLQDGLRAAQKARHTGISGQTVGAVVRASAFREAAAYRAMIAAAQEATDDAK